MAIKLEIDVGIFLTTSLFFETPSATRIANAHFLSPRRRINATLMESVTLPDSFETSGNIICNPISHKGYCIKCFFGGLCCVRLDSYVALTDICDPNILQITNLGYPMLFARLEYVLEMLENDPLS